MSNIPSILTDLSSYLKENKIVAETRDNDGRINSKLDEANVVQKLKEKFGSIIQEVPKRMAGDVLVVDGSNTHVVNVKTTTCQAPDNAYSANGFLLAFTNILYTDIAGSINFAKWSKYITANKVETERDYWFLVINKNTGDAMVRGLKKIVNCKSNPSNIFQIEWGNEFKTAEPQRTFEESWNHIIINTVCESYIKKQKIINEGLSKFNLTASVASS